ncbi:MAG TPA: (d)CMP kinase [Planctomycetaceae bacterium]|nr:(d)CMP kinase [Planctomycetaceae bacterium]
MIVTIDGPAGAGKSSIARQAADSLGFEFLDTGAMYRAVALAGIRADVDWNDKASILRLCKKVNIEFRDRRVWLNGNDVTSLIRTPSVTDVIRHVADIAEIREILTQKQREFVEGRDVVTEGRDQGSEVFPHAQCKIFLTASPEERARRRQQQLSEAGRYVPLEDILVQQNRRDEEDCKRPIGGLRAAQDAIILESDSLSLDEVLLEVLRIVHQRRGELAAAGHL